LKEGAVLVTRLLWKGIRCGGSRGRKRSFTRGGGSGGRVNAAMVSGVGAKGWKDVFLAKHNRCLGWKSGRGGG